jgi:hypothetical protein
MEAAVERRKTCYTAYGIAALFGWLRSIIDRSRPVGEDDVVTSAGCGRKTTTAFGVSVVTILWMGILGPGDRVGTARTHRFFVEIDGGKVEGYCPNNPRE